MEDDMTQTAVTAPKFTKEEIQRMQTIDEAVRLQPHFIRSKIVELRERVIKAQQGIVELEKILARADAAAREVEMAGA
jgi:hypothetical protein